MHAIEIAAAHGPGQDRAAVFDHALVLADGAGGTGGGAAAAQVVIDAVAAMPEPITAQTCAELIEFLDGKLARAGGQTTAIIATRHRTDTGDTIVGASAGDSRAWLVLDDGFVDLTIGQMRKPLVGSGCAAIPFAATWPANATLVVASDGLWNYATGDAIARIARGPDLGVAARELVALVRLASGALPDDVSIIVCRAGGTGTGVRG